MATTSIWRVKGWLGKVVVYVENPDKTINPAFVERKDLSGQQLQGLSDVIDYAANSDKTQAADEQSDVLYSFVSGVNCNPGNARDEMIAVKKRFGKENGTVAYHGYQSFAPGEATPELAHEIGLKLAERLWGERYQVLVTTHLDKESHLHNHFVVNAVSYIDGIKYHRTTQDYRDMQTASDALCQEYGLSVVDNAQPGKAKHYGEWRAEQEQRPTWRGIVRADVDEAIRQSMTERQLFDNLRRKDYEIKIGKDISVRPPGKERFVRLTRNFGEDYSMAGVCQRILEQSRAARPLAKPMKKSRQYHFTGKLKSAKKITGFRALYFHYCYLLGIFPRNRPKSNKRLHFLLREDLAKLDAISQEAKLLAVNHIDTAQQLVSYKDSLETEIQVLNSQRKELYRSRRTIAVKSDPEKYAAINAEISSISKQLSQLRREVKLCDDIAIRSGVMKEKIQAVHMDKQSERKEQKRDEPFRRRG